MMKNCKLDFIPWPTSKRFDQFWSQSTGFGSRHLPGILQHTLDQAKCEHYSDGCVHREVCIRWGSTAFTLHVFLYALWWCVSLVAYPTKPFMSTLLPQPLLSHSTLLYWLVLTAAVVEPVPCICIVCHKFNWYHGSRPKITWLYSEYPDSQNF